MKRITVTDEQGKVFQQADVPIPGDIIYYYTRDNALDVDSIQDYTVLSLEMTTYTSSYYYTAMRNSKTGDDIDFTSDDIGRTVFATFESAWEEAMK